MSLRQWGGDILCEVRKEKREVGTGQPGRVTLENSPTAGEDWSPGA